jgi:hypothetical protein
VAAERRLGGPAAAAGRSGHRWLAAVTLGVALLIGAAAVVGAGHRQRTIEDDLRQAFGGTTRAEIDAMLDAEQGDPEVVFAAIWVRPDGIRRTADTTELRYPASFFGLDRCVYAVWDDDGAEFRRTSGDACVVSLA